MHSGIANELATDPGVLSGTAGFLRRKQGHCPGWGLSVQPFFLDHRPELKEQGLLTQETRRGSVHSAFGFGWLQGYWAGFVPGATLTSQGGSGGQG